jgi:hypothetical protein
LEFEPVEKNIFLLNDIQVGCNDFYNLRNNGSFFFWGKATGA